MECRQRSAAPSGEQHGDAVKRCDQQSESRSHARIIPYGARDRGRGHRALRAGARARARALRARHRQCASMRRRNWSSLRRDSRMRRAAPPTASRSAPRRARASMRFSSERIAAPRAARLSHASSLLRRSRALRRRARAGAALAHRGARLCNRFSPWASAPRAPRSWTSVRAPGAIALASARAFPARAGRCGRHLRRGARACAAATCAD